MNKKQVRFIILLTIAAFFIWLAGEIIIGLFLEVKGNASIIWAITAIVATLAISVIKCSKE